MAQQGFSFCIICTFVLVQIFALSFSFAIRAGNETDRLSLLAFKAAIHDDPLGILSSWNESSHFCQWPGVSCGRRHGRVIELNLNSCKLFGRINPDVGNMSFLRIINLANNSLSHNIPPELGRLLRLQILNLRKNKFGGEIPANISYCSYLKKLELDINNLSGNLPMELGSLSKLRKFIFDFNTLTGEIPSSFGNLSSLQVISGQINHLHGSIPDTIGKLQLLKMFAFTQNNLSGMIPPSMYNLSSLKIFSVAVNQLHGSLPYDLGLTLPSIQVLLFHTNRFSGLIPATISNASNLQNIQLSINGFTGKIPTLERLHIVEKMEFDENNLGNGDENELDFLCPFANNTSLELLAINDNNFGGMLPEILSNFSKKLWWMSFGRNQIHGSIPIGIGNLISLQVLGLEENQLTGRIPSSIGELQQLGALAVNGNKISGTIPNSFGNLTFLMDLDLSGNHLQGSIPSSLGTCRNLLSFSLSQNNLSGPIPKEVIGISSLSKFFNLSANQLTGSLPFEVDKLVNLGILDLSNNKLFGKIPENLGSCSSLEYLYIGRNFFYGEIPQSLRSLRAIRKFNLSNNNFTGKIPEFFAELKLLEILDLSFNDLEGEVPTAGVFQNASRVQLFGNKRVCGGIPQLNLPKCQPTKPKSFVKLILIVAISCVLGMILPSFCLYFFHFRTRRNKSTIQPQFHGSFRRVSYKDLFKATDGFSSTNLIGVGSFGSVYRAILEPDGTTFAVKVLNVLHRGASKSFMVECKTLASIRHRNLVKLVTACCSIDLQGNNFKALIYEFLVNGSLEEWLHPVHGLAEAPQLKSLDFSQKLNIAIDVASAISYLHHGCAIPIVHCDLKPNNVLLDANMTAHVRDFGLARFLSKADREPYSNQISSIGIKGTIGYAAPEYGMGGEISTYGDVYSYGILLLEMFTGTRPTDDIFKDGMNLHNYVKIALQSNVLKVVYPVPLSEDEEMNIKASHKVSQLINEKIQNCLISVLKIGVACSEESPTQRMEMSNVVAELYSIKNMLL